MVQLNCNPSFKHFFLHKFRYFYTCNLKSFTYFLQFGVKCPPVLFKAGWNFWMHRSQSHWEPQDSLRSSGQGMLWWFPVPWCSTGGHSPAWGCQSLQAFTFHFAEGIFLTAEHMAAQTHYWRVWAWPWSPRPTGAKNLLQWAVNHPQLPAHLMIWIDKLSPEFLEFNFRNTVIYAERKNTYS